MEGNREVVEEGKRREEGRPKSCIDPAVREQRVDERAASVGHCALQPMSHVGTALEAVPSVCPTWHTAMEGSVWHALKNAARALSMGSRPTWSAVTAATLGSSGCPSTRGISVQAAMHDMFCARLCFDMIASCWNLRGPQPTTILRCHQSTVPLSPLQQGNYGIILKENQLLCAYRRLAKERMLRHFRQNTRAFQSHNNQPRCCSSHKSRWTVSLPVKVRRVGAECNIVSP